MRTEHAAPTALDLSPLHSEATPPFVRTLPQLASRNWRFSAHVNAPMRSCSTRLAAVEAREKFNKILNEKYGITDSELRLAQVSLKERLLQYHKTLGAAFRTLDKDRGGVVQRQEVLDFFASASGYMQSGVMALTDNVNLGGVSDKASTARRQAGGQSARKENVARCGSGGES